MYGDDFLHSEEDYEMHPNANMIWITVDGLSVMIERLDTGIKVDIYPRFHEMDQDPIDYARAEYDEVFYDDTPLEIFWRELGQVGIDDDGITDMRFLHFPEGIDREVIWKWFDHQHSKGVAWLLNDYNPSE